MTDDHRPPSRSLHTRALLLAAALVAAFIAAAGLYARHGHALVLRVFEANQLARTEGKNPWAVERELEDYLRVDPASQHVRGLLIDHYLEQNQLDRAMEAALAGVKHAPDIDLSVALLRLARVRLARGELEEAKDSYVKIVETIGESGEARFGLAHIFAAWGDFVHMRSEFKSLWEKRAVNSTPEFEKEFQSAYDREMYISQHTLVAASWSAAVAHLRLGWVDSAFQDLLLAPDFKDATPYSQFWRGVAEEEQGNKGEALELYRTAAEGNEPLAVAALRRLDTAK